MPKDRPRITTRRGEIAASLTAIGLLSVMAAGLLTMISVEIDINTGCTARERAARSSLFSVAMIGWPLYCRSRGRDRAWSFD